MFRPTADPPPTCFTTHPHTGCRGRGKVSKPIHCVKSAADSPGYRYRESVSPYTTRASSDTPNAPNHRRPPGEVPKGFCSVAFGAFAATVFCSLSAIILPSWFSFLVKRSYYTEKSVLVVGVSAEILTPPLHLSSTDIPRLNAPRR